MMWKYDTIMCLWWVKGVEGLIMGFKRVQGGSKVIPTQFMFWSRKKDTSWFTDDNPTSFAENVNGKGKIGNCYAKFAGRETLSKAATSWWAWSMA
jgi:hypothetical protein